MACTTDGTAATWSLPSGSRDANDEERLLFRKNVRVNSLSFLHDLWPLEVRGSRAPHAALWHELFRFSGRDASEILFRELPADPDFRKPFLNAVGLAVWNIMK